MPSLYPLGKLQNLSFSMVSKQVAMYFCVFGVALCDIPTCFIIKVVLCSRRNTFASLSDDELPFWWQAKNFLAVSILLLRGMRSTSHESHWQRCNDKVPRPCMPSLYLWGGVQNLSLSILWKQVTMKFCVFGVALRIS